MPCTCCNRGIFGERVTLCTLAVLFSRYCVCRSSPRSPQWGSLYDSSLNCFSQFSWHPVCLSSPNPTRAIVMPIFLQDCQFNIKQLIKTRCGLFCELMPMLRGAVCEHSSLTDCACLDTACVVSSKSLISALNMPLAVVSQPGTYMRFSVLRPV